jgi:hypothetical protein
VFCSVCEQLVRGIHRIKTIRKHQFDNQSETAESDGVGDYVYVALQSPDVLRSIVNAVWVVARNHFVPFLGYPIFDVGVLKNVKVFWDFDIFD